MYINVAYVDDENPNVEDLTTPIKINNCGYYRIHTTSVIETFHPEGRNDYQLLYIQDLESGSNVFFNEIQNLTGNQTVLSITLVEQALVNSVVNFLSELENIVFGQFIKMLLCFFLKLPFGFSYDSTFFIVFFVFIVIVIFGFLFMIVFPYKNLLVSI